MAKKENDNEHIFISELYYTSYNRMIEDVNEELILDIVIKKNIRVLDGNNWDWINYSFLNFEEAGFPAKNKSINLKRYLRCKKLNELRK